MAATDYYDITQQLYIAYFGRPADPAGLRAFAASLESLGVPNWVEGLSAAYGVPANAPLRALIDSFGASGESARLYSAATTADFVAGVFDNIFHRAPAASGLAFWTAELDSGRVGKAEAALKIMAGAYLNTSNPQQARLDQTTVEHKLAAAAHFTRQLDSTGTSDHYRGEDAAWQARYMLGQVDSAGLLDYFHFTVESVVRQIAGQEAASAPHKLANGAAYAGSGAAERVLVGATTASVRLGEGDDMLFLKAAGPGAGGQLDGGGGIDTLVMDAAHAIGAAREARPLASVSGFERLLLTSLSNETIDVGQLGFTYVGLGGTNPRAVNGARLDNLASGATLAVDSGVAALTVNVRDAQAGAADVLQLSINTDHGTYFDAITVPHVETIRFLTHDPAIKPPELSPTGKLFAPALNTFVTSGNAGLSLTLEARALTSFDASGQSGALRFALTGGLDSAVAIRGGSAHNTVDFSSTSGAVTYTGGAGQDELKAGSGATLIQTGAGRDTVELVGGSHRVDLGADNDAVSVWFGDASVISGGAGTDEFTFNAAGTRSASLFPTIGDFAMNERISFYYMGMAVDQETKVGAAVAPGAGATFRDYLDAATAADGSGHRGKFNWFVFEGDTYLVVDRSASASFQDGRDQLVKLAGIYDLSASSFHSATLFGTAL